MTPRVRFAPSPTGELHVGNARTALFNFLFARQQGGVFILRIEDTDVERSETRFETQLMEDLRWLGLNWDEGPDIGGALGPYRQSERSELYLRFANRLIDAGSAYYCFCSPDDIEKERQVALASGQQPKYSGRCRSIPLDAARARKSNGELASIRLRIPDHPLRFEDLVHGPLEFPSEVIGDPILVRSTGIPAFNYAVVIDDALMLITHVIRGDDHISNTPRQVALFEALSALPRLSDTEPDWKLPLFAHLSTILGPDHTRLSKRHGATSLGHFRASGILPEALANYLALLGWAPGDNREIFPMPDLIEAFRLSQVSRNPAIFDLDKLRWLNRHYLKESVPERILDLAIPALRDAGYVAEPLVGPARKWWLDVLNLLLPSVDELSQLPSQARVLFEYDPKASLALDETRHVLAEPGAREVIDALWVAVSDNTEITSGRFKDILDQVKKESRQKGKGLFHPVRIALTGSTSGPQLDRLIPLIEAGSRLQLPKPIMGCRNRLIAFREALSAQP